MTETGNHLFDRRAFRPFDHYHGRRISAGLNVDHGAALYLAFEDLRSQRQRAIERDDMSQTVQLVERQLCR